MKHHEKIIVRRKDAVFDIRLACLFRNTGQTGTCVNVKFTNYTQNIEIKGKISRPPDTYRNALIV